MKNLNIIILFSVIFTQQYLFSQESLNINFLSNLPYNQELSDVWGYSTDEGEYALVGVFDGISVVDVTNSLSPIELAFFPGPESIWRDLKTWGNYLYCINDQNGDGGAGLQIINLSEVISGISNPTYIENMNLQFETAHNIFIDENGVLYVFGADYLEGGCMMFDLVSDPENPSLLGVFDDYYFHDGMVRGDTLWGGAVYEGVFSVVDVSDKQNPIIIGTQSTPNAFTHNCWISDDGDYLFTTDEVSTAFVTSFDVSDLDDISELDRIQAWSLDTDVIPHNTHVDGDFVVTSYYTDGVSVVDVSRPSNIIEVGYYDTSESFSGDGFNGAWGTYPWLPSGNILVTDIENGLYVLESKYSNASYVEGFVSDDITGAAISNAEIQIIGSNHTTLTDLSGFYESGMAESGTYEIIFSAPGYSDAYEVISISSGEVLSFDIALIPFESYSTQFSILSVANLTGISNASVHIFNDDFDYELIADFQGDVYVSLVAGDYSISIGAWGYVTECSSFSISGIGGDLVYELEIGYSDDFSLDLGWEVTNDISLSSGEWERGIPNGTSYGWGQNISLINPEQDASGDCGGYAFVTGNMINADAGSDDVDDGRTTLVSPKMDLTYYDNPVISFETWFQNDGGQGSPPNDSLLVYVSNSIDTVLIDYRTVSSVAEQWVSSTISLENLIDMTNQMYVLVETMDGDPGHLVEAGFDRLFVSGNNIGLYKHNKTSFNVFPNPSKEGIISFESNENGVLVVNDISGRIIFKTKAFKGYNSIDLGSFPSGLYTINLITEFNSYTQVWIRK
ncbi:MAG: hypothetical protein CMP57_00205 [Flavobacteriales bacterium]|nr:hypothetical protein [Flavobacteriales bacterium]